MKQLGIGLGLRSPYFDAFAAHEVPVGWVEIISENYFALGKAEPSLAKLIALEKVRRNYPVVMHGVSLSIGSTDKLSRKYLSTLKALIKEVQPEWVSDHLCWTGVDGLNSHELLPLPYTEEALKHVVARVKIVQDYLGREILLENVSSYISFKHSTMTEWDFLAAVAQESGCRILLDVNNVYVSSVNHGFDPLAYLENIPIECVGQMHLAGHSTLKAKAGTYLVDTHDQPICEEVWDLYDHATGRFGNISTLIERDDGFPQLSELIEEVLRAERAQAPNASAIVSTSTELRA